MTGPSTKEYHKKSAETLLFLIVGISVRVCGACIIGWCVLKDEQKLKGFVSFLSSNPTYFDGYQNHLLSSLCVSFFLSLCFTLFSFIYCEFFHFGIVFENENSAKRGSNTVLLLATGVWETKTKYTKTN